MTVEPLGPDELLKQFVEDVLADLFPTDRGKYRELQLDGRQSWVIVEPDVLTRVPGRIARSANEANGQMQVTCVARTEEQSRAVTNRMLNRVVGLIPGAIQSWVFASLTHASTRRPYSYVGLPEHTTWETICLFNVRAQRTD